MQERLLHIQPERKLSNLRKDIRRGSVQMLHLLGLENSVGKKRGFVSFGIFFSIVLCYSIFVITTFAAVESATVRHVIILTQPLLVELLLTNFRYQMSTQSNYYNQHPLRHSVYCFSTEMYFAMVKRIMIFGLFGKSPRLGYVTVLLVGLLEVCFRATLPYREMAYRESTDFRLVAKSYKKRLIEWWNMKKIVFDDEDMRAFVDFNASTIKPPKKKIRKGGRGKKENKKHRGKSQREHFCRVLGVQAFNSCFCELTAVLVTSSFYGTFERHGHILNMGYTFVRDDTVGSVVVEGVTQLENNLLTSLQLLTVFCSSSVSLYNDLQNKVDLRSCMEDFDHILPYFHHLSMTVAISLFALYSFRVVPNFLDCRGTDPCECDGESYAYYRQFCSTFASNNTR